MKIECDKKDLAVRPDAVLFDLDNTLYDYDRPHMFGLASVRDKLGQSAGIAPARFDTLYEAAKRSVKDDLGECASAHSRLLYFQRLLEMSGLRTDVLMALDCEQTYWRTFLSIATLLPDALEMLRLLRSIGLQSAIATDLTAQIQFRKIVYFGLDSVVDHIVTSEECGADKPSKKFYDLVSRKLELAPGARVWMVGDDVRKDCEGAKTHLGAITFLRTNRHSGRKGPGVDVRFEHFEQLIPLFKQFEC